MFSALLFLALVAVLVFTVTQRQLIRDYVTGLSYTPTTQVTSLMHEMQLTDAGERIFRATKPTLDASQRFNQQCAGVDHSEQGHVLGCFTDEQIHLYGVTDERIEGIVNVTAAHELLHAVYARLGDGERTSLAHELHKAYEELAATDGGLKDRMSLYEHLSDAQFANELHSVLGTEVAELPDELEAHYARWFTDRGSLVEQFTSYHSVFGDLQDQAAALEDEMVPLREDVEARKLAYDDAVEAYNADSDLLSARMRAAGEADEIDEDEITALEEERAAMEERKADLDATLAAIQRDIDHYNELREQLVSLNELSTELDRNLNSELAPVTTRPTT